MSEVATLGPGSAAAAAIASPPGGDAPRPRAWSRRVVSATFSRCGARLGLAWIVVIAFLGVAGDEKASGRVIGQVMKEHGSDLDGGLVNRLVREALSGD